MTALFDAHADTAVRIFKLGESLLENGGHLDIQRLRALGIPAAQCFAICSDGLEWYNGDKWNYFTDAWRYLTAQAERYNEYIELCQSAGSLKRALDAGRLAGILCIEGAELIGDSSVRFDEAYERGVRIISPVWNLSNEFCDTHDADGGTGLTEAGKRLVRRAAERGVITDLSHISRSAFYDALGQAVGPVIASHSNAHALCPHPRNLTDEMFRLIADSGGVAGVTMVSYFLAQGRPAELDDVIRHIEHFWSLGGEKAVALGCDFDGCDELPRGIAQVTDLARLYDRLLARGHNGKLLEDLFFNNMARVVKKVCSI